MKKVPLGAVAAALIAWSVFAVPSCVDSIAVDGIGGADAGYDASFPINSDVEACSQPDPGNVRMRFEPSQIFLEPCQAEPCPTRTVKLIVEPDLCGLVNGLDANPPVAVNEAGIEIDDAGNVIIGSDETTVTFTAGDADVVRTPVPTAAEQCSADATQFCVGYHRPSLQVGVQAGANTGASSLAASFKFLGQTFKAALDVEVLPDEVPTCSGSTSTPKLAGGDTLKGKNGLAGASIALPKGADKDDPAHSPWVTQPFAATMSCASDTVPSGFVPLGPAVTFGPEDLVLQREIPVTIPINPALMPVTARMRHVRVAYSGPAFKKPRTIPVADTRIVNLGGTWALSFQIPRLGTYQAVIANDAGTHSFTRRLTHRAVVGFSMGGGGTAMMVARHHDLFDVMAPLGGPVDWSWELNYIETNHLAGFRPIAPGTTLASTPGGLTQLATACDGPSQCKPDETCLGIIQGMPMSGSCALLPTPTEPYEHAQTYNFWWYEYPSDGNGGHFGRQDYAQIFRDLAIMMGNPNGENLSATAQNLPAGVNPNDKSVLGDHPDGECKMWVDPIDCTGVIDPIQKSDCEKQNDTAKQTEIANNCPTERCAHPLTLQNYYSAEYNPDGAFPVITICDSSPQIEAASPYSNEWQPGFTGYPLEVGLAVDYNGNGVRDYMEPIIRAGHEKWYDYGTDHTPSNLEPGYVKGKNEDPNGDDYNAQYNPSGTEGDHRWEPGEKWDDFGLDGVKGTKQQPPGGWAKAGDGYDVGEGDGKFTVSQGLQTFWDRDPWSIVRGFTDPSKIPAGELNDDALKRLDVWTDGGVRDLFNFGVDAQNLVGGFYTRGRDVQYMSDFSYAPGEDPSQPLGFNAKVVNFDDLPGVVFERYGAVDPTAAEIADGSGKHVGPAGTELLSRIETALYFIGSRWPEPELRTLAQASRFNPDKGAKPCEVDERCDITFPPDGEPQISPHRSGPVSISLPPGYAFKGNSQRYPVVFFLHGYGQDPSGLAGVEALFPNWMADPHDSIATRLPKMIVVYVDGRCRWQKQGGKYKAECLRGTFFTDSVMSQGAQDESWWLDLIQFVDQNFRTLGEAEVDWTE